MKILLIGKTGQLGGDILRLGSPHDIAAPGREELDVTRPETVAAALSVHRPDVVVNTAAFHEVPRCEREPLEAFRVNCVAVRDLAVACRKAGCRLVTFSSDYVFGGEKRTPYLEDDRPAPVQMYGLSRLAGEHAALSAAPDHAVVIRTCGLYGSAGARSKGGNFVDHRIRDGETASSVDMGCDQTVSPTYTADLAKAVAALIDHGGASPGVYHLVNEGECTWYEFTREIYRILGRDVDVRPVDRKGMSGEMRRPVYSVLGNTRARKLGITLPHWRDALRRYLEGKDVRPRS